MTARRSRRLRKKLHLGEFRELGFEVAFELRRPLGATQVEQFWDAFIAEAIERHGLAFGGGGNTGFVTVVGRGSATETHRALVRAWLVARSEVAAVSVGPLVDAWHDGA